MIWLPYVGAGALGALLGLAELLGRYRDAPFAALKNWATVIYSLVNFVASLVTLVFLRKFKLISWPESTIAAQGLAEIAVAGLGALAILRIGITVQVAGQTLTISVMSMLQPILQAADNEVDRARAAERLRITNELMLGLDVRKAFSDLPPLCLALMQAVSPLEQKRLADDIKAIEAVNTSDDTKLISLGSALLGIV